MDASSSTQTITITPERNKIWWAYPLYLIPTFFAWLVVVFGFASVAHENSIDQIAEESIPKTQLIELFWWFQLGAVIAATVTVIWLRRVERFYYLITDDHIAVFKKGELIAGVRTNEVLAWRASHDTSTPMFLLGWPLTFFIRPSIGNKLEIAIGSPTSLEWIDFPPVLYFSSKTHKKLVNTLKDLTGRDEAESYVRTSRDKVAVARLIDKAGGKNLVSYEEILKSRRWVFTPDYDRVWIVLPISLVASSIIALILITVYAISEWEEFSADPGAGAAMFIFAISIGGLYSAWKIGSWKFQKPVQYEINSEFISAQVKDEIVHKYATKEILAWKMDSHESAFGDFFWTHSPSVWFFPLSEPPQLHVMIRPGNIVEWVDFPRLLIYSQEKYDEIVLAMETVTGKKADW